MMDKMNVALAQLYEYLFNSNYKRKPEKISSGLYSIYMDCLVLWPYAIAAVQYDFHIMTI